MANTIQSLQSTPSVNPNTKPVGQRAADLLVRGAAAVGDRVEISPRGRAGATRASGASGASGVGATKAVGGLERPRAQEGVGAAGTMRPPAPVGPIQRATATAATRDYSKVRDLGNQPTPPQGGGPGGVPQGGRQGGVEGAGGLAALRERAPPARPVGEGLRTAPAPTRANETAARPPARNPAGPVGANPAGPPRANPAGPVGANPAGPPRANPAGPPRANPAGPVGANPAGPPRANPAGPVGANPAGSAAPAVGRGGERNPAAGVASPPPQAEPALPEGEIPGEGATPATPNGPEQLRSRDLERGRVPENTPLPSGANREELANRANNTPGGERGVGGRSAPMTVNPGSVVNTYARLGGFGRENDVSKGAVSGFRRVA